MNYSNKAQQAAYKAAWAQYFREIEKGYDIVLPPEEQAPLIITDRDLSAKNANWAIDYLLTDAMLDEVIRIAKAKKSPPVLIAITDTAPWFDHPDLQAFSRNDLAIDFVPGRTAKRDANGHGSHCAGVGVANNPLYRVGIVRKLAEAGLVRVVPVGVLNDLGSGLFGQIANGCAYGVDLQKKAPGHRVITSLSLGGPTDDQGVKDAIDYAIAYKVFFSAAAGNSYGDGSKSTMNFPARHTPVKAVGAIDANGQRASFSSVGDLTNHIGWIAAPGVGILSTYKNSSYAYLDGTSMATPISAFIDACLLLMYPELQTQGDLKGFLAEFATDLPPSTNYDIFTFFGAPKLGKYMDKTPGKVDPPKEDPPTTPNPPAPKLRAERVLDVPITGEFFTWWKPINEGSFREIYLQLTIDFKTKYFAEHAVKTLHEKVKAFFTDSAYVLLPDDDLNEAIYWIRHFTEMIFKSDGFDVSVTALIGKDKAGNILKLTGDDRRGAQPAGALQKRNGNVQYVKVGKRGEVARIPFASK